MFLGESMTSLLKPRTKLAMSRNPNLQMLERTTRPSHPRGGLMAVARAEGRFGPILVDGPILAMVKVVEVEARARIEVVSSVVIRITLHVIARMCRRIMGDMEAEDTNLKTDIMTEDTCSDQCRCQDTLLMTPDTDMATTCRMEHLLLSSPEKNSSTCRCNDVEDDALVLAHHRRTVAAAIAASVEAAAAVLFGHTEGPGGDRMCALLTGGVANLMTVIR